MPTALLWPNPERWRPTGWDPPIEEREKRSVIKRSEMEVGENNHLEAGGRSGVRTGSAAATKERRNTSQHKKEHTSGYFGHDSPDAVLGQL
jgi:hypothetical protein